MTENNKLKDFYGHLAQIRRLKEIIAILDWDRAVNLPPAGSESRAEQIQDLSVRVHSLLSADSFYDLIQSLNNSSSISPDDAVNLREVKRTVEKQRKLPEEFVARQTMLQSISYDTWAAAKPKGDFEAVRKNLVGLVDLAREETKLLGFSEHPYDALLDHYEPGAKLSEIKPLLLRLGEGLSAVLPEITEKFKGVRHTTGHFAKEKQHELSNRILAAIGFDFECGRLDASPHPFSTSLGWGDWRITTRYHEDKPLSAIYSTLHEAGHAFYDMGLKKEHRGTPLGEAVSLGIHESQSRLWENLIGRSQAFASILLPLLRDVFPAEFSAVFEIDLWREINFVEPSLIRVEADEVSYSLHIVIRMLLEEALISGDLSVNDAPAAWNDLYKKYLGVSALTPDKGIMQDVHWYSGSFGYFPTYALGNLYGVVMLKKAQEAGAGLPSDIAEGRFSKLREWLTKNVHESGMRLYGPDLLRQIAGVELSEKPFLDYIKQKFLG